jgi:hypothetical protein
MGGESDEQYHSTSFAGAAAPAQTGNGWLAMTVNVGKFLCTQEATGIVHGHGPCIKVFILARL